MSTTSTMKVRPSSTRQDADPSSGFLLSLQVLMWTVFTLGLISILVIFMIT